MAHRSPQTPYLSKLPRRSRIYGLEPIGLDTPMQESLYSYFLRISERHCTSPHRLSVFILETHNFPLRRLINGTLRLSSHDIAGAGVGAESLALALQKENDAIPFRNLTLLPFREHLPTTGRGGRFRQWCPLCIEENQQLGQNYYPLIWEFSAAKACPIHKCTLSTICSNCDTCFRKEARFSSVRIGYCNHCGKWLGKKASKVLYSNEYDVACSQKILEWIGDLDSQHDWSFENMIKSLRLIRDHRFDGNARAFSEALGLRPPTVHPWLHGRHRPSVEHLLRISMLSGEPLSALISNKIRAASKTFKTDATHSPPRSRRRKRLTRSAALKMLDTLPTSPPPSLAEVERRTGYCKQALRLHAPKELAEIQKAYANWRRDKVVDANKSAQAATEKLATEYTNLTRRDFWPASGA